MIGWMNRRKESEGWTDNSGNLVWIDGEGEKLCLFERKEDEQKEDEKKKEKEEEGRKGGGRRGGVQTWLNEEIVKRDKDVLGKAQEEE